MICGLMILMIDGFIVKDEMHIMMKSLLEFCSEII